MRGTGDGGQWPRIAFKTIALLLVSFQGCSAQIATGGDSPITILSLLSSRLKGSFRELLRSGSTWPAVPAERITSTRSSRVTRSTRPPHVWQQGITTSHFWDCNGASCDAATLQPLDNREYKYAPQYAPVDPSNYGGPIYGERLWMTGRTSDTLSALLGRDDGCCGTDTTGGGGCGRCILVRNPSARHADWTAVVMKKGQCPPSGHGSHDEFRLDVAVPAYDLPNQSSLNVCGNPNRTVTYITQTQSGFCGSGQQPPGVCDCGALHGETVAQQFLRDGCSLFREWGWATAINTLEFSQVACPTEFVRHVSSAFGPAGVQDIHHIMLQKVSTMSKRSFGAALTPQHRMPAVVSLLVCCLAALVAAVLLLSRLTRGIRRGEGCY